MAVIHVDPLPPRTGPGDVMRFVCDRTGLDGKKIGKITLIGRGATVEVPDDKAAAVVAKLDGATFRDKPVRARLAGKAAFANADHFSHLSHLLDLEGIAEAAEAKRRAALGHDSGDGSTLTALTLKDTDIGLGGRFLLTFARVNNSGPLPPNRLGPGSPVVVTQTGTTRGLSLRGVVFDRDERTLGVAVEMPDIDMPDDAVWRIDLSPDEVSRQRQQDALRRARAAETGRLAELKAVLLGEREPEFDTVEAPAPTPSALNGPQEDAVRFALAAKDVAIIHGPPGTGKTTTVVELIRRAVARGDRVLVCAPSNLAVDNVLDKLLAAGERPVRLGHPARVVAELRDRALDMLVEKHPDARQARKVAREAGALFRQADKWTRGKPAPGEKAALRREARALLGEARKLEALAVERIMDDARIVCATLTGLDSEVLGQRRYDLAVIDEAGQSTEPAAWLPLLRADRLVLAGDHCQLPPTVVSPDAAKGGLAVSLMERLAALHGDGVSRLLTVQYRMNGRIMQFPSTEFYGGGLHAHPSVADHLLRDLPGIVDGPLAGVAYRFIDTAGGGLDEEAEEETGSRFNRGEARLAAGVVRDLLAAGLPATGIAVIAPYRAQVRLLRDMLNVPGLEIDSVDGFQGREKNAVVVSLVRSNPEGEIGFLADTRRTNVAVTRARRSLTVIGDGATLSNDPFYERMLTDAQDGGGYLSVWELET